MFVLLFPKSSAQPTFRTARRTAADHAAAATHPETSSADCASVAITLPPPPIPILTLFAYEIARQSRDETAQSPALVVVAIVLLIIGTRCMCCSNSQQCFVHIVLLGRRLAIAILVRLEAMLEAMLLCVCSDEDQGSYNDDNNIAPVASAHAVLHHCFSCLYGLCTH